MRAAQPIPQKQEPPGTAPGLVKTPAASLGGPNQSLLDDPFEPS